jgi:hypothetical protein
VKRAERRAEAARAGFTYADSRVRRALQKELDAKKKAIGAAGRA